MNALTDVHQTWQAWESRDPLEVVKFCCWSGSGRRPRISFSLSLTLADRYFYYDILSLTRRRHRSGLSRQGSCWLQSGIASAGAVAQLAAITARSQNTVHWKTRFQPIAVESLGPMNCDIHKFLADIGRRISRVSVDERVFVSMQLYFAISVSFCFVTHQ